ncbi:peptidylprolyl isomerase, partial [Pseudoalteromonas ruthenica]
EGVQLMKAGDKFRFFIHPNLGYGDQAAGKIEPGSLLIFEVELLKIES